MQTVTQFNTAHDFKPSYTPQPAIVTEAREAAARAWQRVSELADEYEALQKAADAMNTVDEKTAVVLTVAQDAVKAAQAADAWYRDVYAAWQRGDEASIACACTPTGDTCPACKAKAAADPDGVYNF